MKKLIPALCMLLVAATLLGTSTFAWFTMNDTVTADGMQVKAAATGGLLISTYDGDKTGDARFTSGFKASVTAENDDVTSLSPTSTSDASTWYTAMAAYVGEKTVDAAEGVKVVTGSGYYSKNDFAVKPAGSGDDQDHSLIVSEITVKDVSEVTSTSQSRKNLNKSLRVALVFEDQSKLGTKKVMLFAPYYNSTKSDNSLTWQVIGGASAANEAPVYATANGYGNVTSTTKEVVVYDAIPALSVVNCYVYYEGEDENCFTSNATLGVDTLEVSFSLKSVERKHFAVSIEAQADEAADITATASKVYGDGDEFKSVTYTYAWFVNGAEETGATAATLTWKPEYAGKEIYCAATASYGSKSETVYSKTVVGLGSSATIEQTTVEGAVNVKAGSIKTNNLVNAYAYQWYVDGALVSGATTASLAYDAAYEGKKAKLEITFMKDTTVVDKAFTNEVIIAGEPDVTIEQTTAGAPIVATVWSTDDAKDTGYKWYKSATGDNGSYTLITGATTDTLAWKAEYEGMYIYCEATVTNGVWETAVESAASNKFVSPLI